MLGVKLQLTNGSKLVLLLNLVFPLFRQQVVTHSAGHFSVASCQLSDLLLFALLESLFKVTVVFSVMEMDMLVCEH